MAMDVMLLDFIQNRFQLKLFFSLICEFKCSNYVNQDLNYVKHRRI